MSFQREDSSYERDGTPVIVAKILLNSSKELLLTLFMLVLAYGTFSLGYTGAAIFFGVVTLLFGTILYRKLSNEWVRAQFGEYRLDL